MARCTRLCTGGIFFLRHLICWLFYTSISCSISRGHQEKKIFLIPSWTVCKWKSVIYQDTSCRRGQKCLCTPDSALPGSTQGLPGLPCCSLQFCRDFQGTLWPRETQAAPCMVWNSLLALCGSQTQITNFAPRSNWGMQTWRMRPGVRGLHL